MKQIKKKPDAEKLYLFVQHMGRRLRDIDLAMGISPARFSALVHLAFHGIDNVGELAASERVSRPAMTRLVRDMETDGLVRRLIDKSDGRGVKVELTQKGRRIVDQSRRKKIALITQLMMAGASNEQRAIETALEAFESFN